MNYPGATPRPECSIFPAKRLREYRSGARHRFIPFLFVAMLTLIAGCGTPYTRRVGQLDDAYQRGDISREDYLRFVHEAEQWDAR